MLFALRSHVVPNPLRLIRVKIRYLSPAFLHLLKNKRKLELTEENSRGFPMFFRLSATAGRSLAAVLVLPFLQKVTRKLFIFNQILVKKPPKTPKKIMFGW